MSNRVPAEILGGGSSRGRLSSGFVALSRVRHAVSSRSAVLSCPIASDAATKEGMYLRVPRGVDVALRVSAQNYLSSKCVDGSMKRLEVSHCVMVFALHGRDSLVAKTGCGSAELAGASQGTSQRPLNPAEPRIS